MSDTSLAGFILAALIVLLIPGPGVLYVVTRSLVQGRKAGMVSVLGLSTGALVHVIAATAGLSAILLSSATAFSIVKFLGVFYLIYLGVRTLLSRQPTADFQAPKPESLYRIFADGILISVLNPKIALFFLAFLPQFVTPEQGSISIQFMQLGLLYVALAICTDGSFALFASSLRNVFSRQLMLGSLPKYTSGFIYLGMGLSLAFTDRKV
ncbi:MAG: threonine/homoserine/homoserine lactone efflux protein [Parasphingorhabdus sp.]|jgi:threonine/homoserine/homoserine lactone efflux protein